MICNHQFFTKMILLWAIFLMPISLLAQDEEDPGSEPAATEEDNTNSDSVPNSELDSLPILEEMKLPSAKKLLQGPVIDWVVLKQGQHVIEAAAIYPRPNTVEKIRVAVEKESHKQRGRNANEETRRLYREKLDSMSKIDIAPPGKGNAPPEYQIHIKHIEQIIYHEDLMLRRAGRMLDDGDLRGGYELILAVAYVDPNWPNIDQFRHKLLFVEGKNKNEKKSYEEALAYLQDLYSHAPEYEGLSEQFGIASDQLIQAAMSEADYRRARYFVHRLGEHFPRHSVYRDWRSKLEEQASQLVQQAEDAFQNQAYADAAYRLAEATPIWPSSQQLQDANRRISPRFQQLRVGVLELTKNGATAPSYTELGQRYQYLSEASLFEVSNTSGVPQYSSGFFEQWEPTDLGRRVLFSLRQSRSPSESQSVVNASSIVSALMARIDPQSPNYDERLSSYVDYVDVKSPYQLELLFSRVPARIEPLLTFSPVINQVEPSDALPQQVPSARFVIHTEEENRVTYRRSVSEPENLRNYHVAEIIEVQQDSYESAIRSLLRGDVSALSHLPPWTINQFQQDGRFFVQKYSLPTTHVIQINPNSEKLKKRSLRRALAYALDRQPVLDQVVLRDQGAGFGRIVTAPYPQNSYAYETIFEPRQHDLILSRILSLGAIESKEEGLPKLRIRCEADPIAQAACAALIKQWQHATFELELLPADDQSADWDLAYRTVRMTEPLVDLWPFLTGQETARVDALASIPDMLRHELIALDSTSDWNRALRILRQIHRHLWEEVQYIPLWEVDDYLVVRKNIEGVATEPVHLYQDVEQWTVTPWLPPDFR